MPPKSFVLEPGTTPPPDNAPDVTTLADAAETPAPAEKPASKKDKGPDTAGIEQFLKAQIGSDRYKQVAPPPKPAPEPEEDEESGEGRQRGPDGKFLPKEKEKPAKPEKPKKAEEKKPVAPAKPAPFKPKPAAAAATQMTPEQVVAAAAEGAARAIASSKPKEEAPAKKPEEAELPPDELEKVEILTKMEEVNPTKYKGLAAKYKASLTALETYAKTWEHNNPGQSFDEESPEHEAFFAENDVDWSDLDFQKAIAKMMAEESVKGVADKTEKDVAELRRAETLRQKQSEIANEQNNAALNYWRELGDDMADVLNADGTLNMVKVKELQESDPEAWNIRVAAAQSLDIEVAEIYKLYNGLTDNDWEKNPVHRNINQFAFTKEKELSAKATQDKLNAEGKIFVPAAEWFRMTKADRERHWTFTAQDLAYMRAADLATLTQKRLELAEEAHKRWAKARGIQLENPDEKPVSPSAGGESRMAAVTGEVPKKTSNVAENFLRTQLKGS